MGTRNLTLVYYKGAWHIAQYGQWDGYPKGQGLTVLRFVANPENVSKLKAVIDAGNILYEPTEEQVIAWDVEKDRALNEDCEPPSVVPSVCRETCAKILNIVANATEPVPIVKDLSTIGYPLICMWAYVVDLDEGAIEVYASPYVDTPYMIKAGDETRFVEDENFMEFKARAFPDLIGKWMLDDLPSEHDFLGWFEEDKCGDIPGGCDAGEDEH